MGTPPKIKKTQVPIILQYYLLPLFTTATKSTTQDVDVDVDADTTVDAKVNPAVEHTHVKKAHETREQTFVEKEKHQDHYHTTVQPLKDSEVLPEKHDYEQESKEKKFESSTKEPTIVDEHVHHHLHGRSSLLLRR